MVKSRYLNINILKNKLFQISAFFKKTAKKIWIRKWLRYALISLFSLFLLFHILNKIFPLPALDDYSQIVETESGEIQFATLNSTDKWRFKAELDEITPVLKKTILEKEDKYFYYHYGINPVSVLRASWNNIFKSKRKLGASTITMQLARMMERKDRTYGNKFIEMFRALQIESKYSKDEILQLYLNHIPYGGNIEGVKTAAFFYYNQKPETLSLSQMVILSIIPNFPNIIHGDADDLLQKRNYWLKQFSKSKLFDKAQIEDAFDEELNFERRERPHKAPHLSHRLCRWNSGENKIVSTISDEIQARAENLVYNYVKPLKFNNINNASVLIIDNISAKVVAYIGSDDFFDNNSSGQVDGVVAIRSPGSALKPLIYAHALDLGLITPKTKVPDVPYNFSGYNPGNYDSRFRGLVSIEQALTLSLNLPSVKLLDEVGVNNFINLLIKSGFKQIAKDKKNLGLSLILGGCGVSLEELTNLFSAFARGGIYKKATLYSGQEVEKPQRIISSASAFMITQMLSKVEGPDFPSNWGDFSTAPKIAWKTGTSYGRRDAWSIGYNRKYTVGVWVGNFDGRGTPELTGANVATPLLFQIFNAIDNKQEQDWFIPPQSIDYWEVCSESGSIPNDFCEDLTIDTYIPGISPNNRCQHKIEVFTDVNETESYCRFCKPESNVKRKLYRHYPAEVIAFFEEENIPYDKIPPHNENCTKVFSQNGPVISSLTEGVEYIFIANENQKMMLKANVENSVENVWWYVNDKLLKKALAKEKIFFIPPEGEVKISCTDDKGRNTNIWVTVKYI